MPSLPGPLAAVQAVGDKLGDLKSKLVEFAFGLNQVTDAVGLVRSAFGQFVQAFRPDVMVRFEQVAKDLLGTIGENLVPIIQLATGFFKQFADIIAGFTPKILPIIKQVTAAMQPLIDQFFNFFSAIADVGVLQMIVDIQTELWGILGSIFESISPIIMALVKEFMFFEQILGGVVLGVLKVVALNFQVMAFALRPFNAILEGLTQTFGDLGKTMFDIFGMIGEIFGELLEVLAGPFVAIMNDVVEGIKQITAYFRYFLNIMREMIGLDPISNNKGESRGKAQGGANWTTTDDLYKKLAAATFGGGREEKPEVKSMGYLASISENIATFAAPLKKALDIYNQIPTKEEAMAAPGQAYDKAAGFLGDLARSMTIKSR